MSITDKISNYLNEGREMPSHEEWLNDVADKIDGKKDGGLYNSCYC